MKIHPWTAEQVAAEKARIKAELDATEKAQGPKARLETVLRKIQLLEDDPDRKAPLQRFIYVVSALVHQVRHGKGLGPSQVRRLVRLGDALLRAERIPRQASRLNFLYGDLHYSAANLYFQAGELWTAAWERQLAFFLSQRNPVGGKGFREFTTGIDLLRQGYATQALVKLESAEQLGLEPALQTRCLFERVSALRLKGEREAALALLEKALRETKLDDEIRADLEFESQILASSPQERARALVAFVRRRGSSARLRHALTAFFWTRGVTSRAGIEQFPTWRRLAGNLALGRRAGLWQKAADTLERCYDDKIPLELRLERLKECLSRSSRLSQVGYELLLWAGATRWLKRNKLVHFALLTESRYRALSFCLTEGKSADTLEILGPYSPS